MEPMYEADSTSVNRDTEESRRQGYSGWHLAKAFYLRRYKFFDRLVAWGADVNAQCPEQSLLSSSLQRLCKELDVPVCSRIAIERGANVRGSGALAKAAARGLTGMVKYLLTQGSCVNEQLIRGHTALSSAISSGRLNVVRLLLREGANPLIRDKDGLNALERARAMSSWSWENADIFRAVLMAAGNSTIYESERGRERRVWLSTERNEPSSWMSFLDLPREIRDMIYVLVLTPEQEEVLRLSPQDVRLDWHYEKSKRPSSANAWYSKAFQDRMKLLRSNSTVHAEASQVLFQYFFFSFPGWSEPQYCTSLSRWLAETPFCSMITKLRLSKDIKTYPRGNRFSEPWPGVFKGSLISTNTSDPKPPKDFRILAEKLGHLSFVSIALFFVDQVKDVSQQKDRVIQTVVALTRPFCKRGVEMELVNFDHEHSTHAQIIAEASEMLGARYRGVGD